MALADLVQHDAFIRRHLGPSQAEQAAQLELLGLESLEQLIAETVPADILMTDELSLDGPQSETAALQELRTMAKRNTVARSYIGMGYYPSFTPAVIQRNVLENPGWYTAYTPYQAEISQGRLESLLTFQQMVMDLTGMTLANASLLDEASAAAEAMTLLKRASKSKSNSYLVAPDVHPQTLSVIQTRARYLGIEVIIDDPQTALSKHEVFGLQLQYPGSTGNLSDIASFIKEAHHRGILVAVASDLLSLVLLAPPGELGADVVLGSAQRFGIPMGYGGPHAAFFATRDEYKRITPGRIIGVSVDARGETAYRMAMQTREQHIRREKATSNICTAQALLANMSAFYAMYHGAEGLKIIASRVHMLTNMLAAGLQQLGFELEHAHWFDTLSIHTQSADIIYQRGLHRGINLRYDRKDYLGISLDETTTLQDVLELWTVFAGEDKLHPEVPEHAPSGIPANYQRQSTFLNHPVFKRYHSETEMLRYLKKLENKDFSLTHGMIPLGSCTMKLNATSEMIPISWPELANVHPFAPQEQAQGYKQMTDELEYMLKAITGYDAFSMQPNSGAQGEYAGLLAIRRYQASLEQGHRDICLIPSSAHGTNPASAIMMGLRVIVIKTDHEGNIDLDDLRQKASEHQNNLSALMITYPSTHGVFEETVVEACDIVHRNGGQVYMDGANLNAQVGITQPAAIGADVSHLNLHKTFCIPHGGGGPGMGPIGVKAHLIPFLPGHHQSGSPDGAVTAAPYGSALILSISWMYIRMMGAQGLKQASQLAILNANYIAKRLENHYNVLYKGQNGRVAHECIIDIRPIRESCGITEEDIAKRLMDYGFHAPTMSWPVPGTMMIEPTESESRAELDRFCDAMIQIREEIRQVENGKLSAPESPLRYAPHTLADLVAENWQRPYSREQAVFPMHSLRANKFWPSINRIDNAYGDRNFVCSCPSMEVYEADEVIVG